MVWRVYRSSLVLNDGMTPAPGMACRLQCSPIWTAARQKQSARVGIARNAPLLLMDDWHGTVEARLRAFEDPEGGVGKVRLEVGAVIPLVTSACAIKPLIKRTTPDPFSEALSGQLGTPS